jgi:hypothetical protein
VPVGDEVVHDRTLTMDYAGELVWQHEKLFLARVDVPSRSLGSVASMHASDGIAAWHWWTLTELDATTEKVWPEGLADLIRSVLCRPAP